MCGRYRLGRPSKLGYRNSVRIEPADLIPIEAPSAQSLPGKISTTPRGTSPRGYMEILSLPRGDPDRSQIPSTIAGVKSVNEINVLDRGAGGGPVVSGLVLLNTLGVRSPRHGSLG